MSSVKDVFKDEFNDIIKEKNNFLIINKNNELHLRIINNVDHFNVVFIHNKDNKLYLCNKLNKFINNRRKKCKHCDENIYAIKMVFTTILRCDINDNIIDETPKIWFIPKFKFNDVFLPFHKNLCNIKNEYIMKDYIFNVYRNYNDFHKISNKYKPINETIKDLTLDECINIIKEKYKESNNET